MADPGLPVGSQTDIPLWVCRRSMRRGGREGGGWREAAGVELAPVTQPVLGLCGAQRQRHAVTRYCQRPPPRGGWCSGHRAAVRRVCRHQRPGGKAGFLPPSKRRPGLGLSPVSASRAHQRAHRHATTMTARQATSARVRGAHRHHADEQPAARTGGHRARRADHRLAARHDGEPGEDPADTLPLPAPGEQL